MFWGSFTYDKKGPCHVWKPETVKEKKTVKEELDRLNAELKPKVKRKWELETSMKRLNLKRKTEEKKPVWKFTKAREALVRDSKSGIDWYRYQKIIFEEKLLSFAQQLKYENGIDVIVQEDKVSAHASAYQKKIFMNWDIMRFSDRVTSLIWIWSNLLSHEWNVVRSKKDFRKTEQRLKKYDDEHEKNYLKNEFRNGSKECLVILNE